MIPHTASTRTSVPRTALKVFPAGAAFLVGVVVAPVAVVAGFVVAAPGAVVVAAPVPQPAAALE